MSTSRGQKKVLSFRTKVIYTVLILLGFRLLAHVPLPFVNSAYISTLMNTNGSLSFFNALTGGSFESMTVMALGITPYITASIVIQLLGVAIPRLGELQKEGATGRKTIERISIVLAAVLGFLQSLFMMMNYGRNGLLSNYTWYTVLIPALIMTGGVFVLAYAGQVISDRFFGNGTSLILLAGILASYLTDMNTLFTRITGSDKLWLNILSVVIAIAAVLLLFGFTFYLNYCEKRIHITYSQRMSAGGSVTAQKSVIPLKLIAGSVVPIIFASTLMSIPAVIQSFTGTDIKFLYFLDTSKWFSKVYPWATLGVILYCVLIIGFSYYYNSLNLNEVELATNLKKHGGYINGIRPGKPTSDYLRRQMKYLTLLGALGLCVIAIVPTMLTGFLGLSRLSFLGTSIIITVSVIVETQKSFMSEMEGYNAQHSSFLNIQNSKSIFGDVITRREHE